MFSAPTYNPYPATDAQQLLINQQQRSQRNQERALALEQAMFEWRSRHLVLVLLLRYKPAWRGTTTLSDLQRDRDTLWNKIRSNELLRGINGYIWKIEEGDYQGGLHMHVVLFYDGVHRADVHIARLIGEYWANGVTKGRGEYWNSNADRERFINGPWGDAIGQIDRNNTAKRNALCMYLVNYVCKDDQHVASRDNPRSHMFGTSRLPGQ